jgi:integrase
VITKQKYERKSLRFSPNDVDKAISYSKSRAIVGRMAEWRDEKTIGLTLRITPLQAVWYLRRRDVTLRLGFATEIDLDKVRYIAEQARLAASRKRDLRTFVDTLVALEIRKDAYGDPWNWKTADEFADETSVLAQRRRTGDTGATWTWEALTHKFLEYKLPKLKKRYRDKYERYLRLDALKTIKAKLVSEVTLADLERVRDQIFLDHKPSAVHRALTQSKVMLTWAWKYHATRSGLDQVHGEWWNRWSFEYSTNERTHTPTIDEIARTLVLAEKHRKLADGEHETYPGTLGALWGVALTGQRTGAFMQLKLERMFGTQKLGKQLKGWKIANWTAEEMKGGRDGGRPHSLPLPPDALKVLEQFHQEAGGNSPWMFPGRDPERPITQSALNLLMYRLQGRVFDHTKRRKPDRSGKPGPKPKAKQKRRNLFEEYDIRPWTLHDARRTLTTFLDDHRLGGAASAILGHKTSRLNLSDRERLAPITELHYNQSQKIELKADGMKLWVRALLTACSRERKNVK